MRRIYSLLLSIALLLAWTIPVAASVEASRLPESQLDTEALDAYITGQMSKHGNKGSSLAVTSGAAIVYLQG